MNVILIAVIILGLVGLVASIMLYAASKKFAVVEDERIGQVAEVLPQANCGGCGYPGCAGFAAAWRKMDYTLWSRSHAFSQLSGTWILLFGKRCHAFWR